MSSINYRSLIQLAVKQAVVIEMNRSDRNIYRTNKIWKSPSREGAIEGFLFIFGDAHYFCYEYERLIKDQIIYQ